MAVVNNVTRLLDQRHIQYEAFELPAEKLGARETAALLGIDPAVVYKTIVVTRDKPKKPLLVVVPGDSANSKLFQIQSKGGHPGQLSAEELAIVKAWIDSGALER